MARRLRDDQLRGHVRLHRARAARPPPRRGAGVIDARCARRSPTARAWLVGGALRDRLLGRPTADLDVVVDGDARAAARALGRASRAAPRSSSPTQFGAWRVVARDRSWQVDFVAAAGRLAGGRPRRPRPDVNAMAEPLAGGELVDPHGGERDLRERRLRMVAPDRRSPAIRCARCASCGWPPSSASRSSRATAAAAREQRGARWPTSPPSACSPSCGASCAPTRAVRGLALLDELGAAAVVLPELGGAARRRAEPLPPPRRPRAHDRGARSGRSSSSATRRRSSATSTAARVARAARRAAGRRADPRRRAALRARCCTTRPSRRRAPSCRDGRVGVPRPRRARAPSSRATCSARLRASERLRAHVAALTRHHLRLGFLVHDMPLDRRARLPLPLACEPVEADVTLLSRRRPPGHPRAQGRRGDRAPPRARPPDARRGARAAAARAPRRRSLRGDELAAEVGHRARARSSGGCWRGSPRRASRARSSTREEAIALARAALREPGA